MKASLKILQDNNFEKVFKFDELCPYLFDKSITSMSFPKHFEMPKFTKYQGKGDPHHHIKEFYMACQEVAYYDNDLLQLFPKSLCGSSLECFSKLPFGVITTFANLLERFVAHYHYNVEKDISMLDLCQAKQKGGESLLDYIQRWRALVGHLPCIVPNTQLVPIFINNLHPKLAYHICLNCAATFKDMMTKGPSVEQALIDEGIIKLYKESFDKPSGDRKRYWNKNKNVVGDGITNSKIVQMVMATKPPLAQTYFNQQSYVNPSPMIHVNPLPQAYHNPQMLTSHVQTNHTNAITVSQAPLRWTYYNNQRCQFTPMGEPLDAIFKCMEHHNMVVYPQTIPFDESKPKPDWYKENEYRAYHHVKGHATNKCMKLKDLVQDLIDEGKTDVDPTT